MTELETRFFSHDLVSSMEWTIAGAQHEVLVWRRGTAAVKEFEFASGRAGRIVPRTSNIWVVPAGDRASALATETTFEIARLTLPASLSETTALRPVVDRQDRLLHHMIEGIAATVGRTDPVGRLLLESLVDIARLHIVDAYSDRPIVGRTVRDLGPGARRAVIERLHDDAANTDLATLADLAGMSPDVFRRAFGRAFHTTPHRYLLERRIRRARTLLVTTEMSMTEIGEALGFATPSHFATTFKRWVGTTPSAYRSDAGGRPTET